MDRTPTSSCVVHHSKLLAHDHAQATAPALSKAHAHDLQVRGKIIQEIVRRMESQCRRHKIDERQSMLQSNPLKITIASDLLARVAKQE